MGVVYRGRDTRLERFVALKVLPPDKIGDPERKQRFVREAMLASALNHPNIVTIHDIAREGEQEFIVMELIEGRSLHHEIPPDGLEFERALHYAVQIAEAMATAHEAGIIHRDLKPHNVMVIGEGKGAGRIKVLDFGVAKLNPAAEPDPQGATWTALTGRGETLGTLAYMSPEQLRGEIVDTRSDIFSLGVVCYEMLTGRLPFHGAHEIDLAHEIYFSKPEPVTHFRPDLPDALEALIARTLSKQRSGRPESMDTLRGELAALIGGAGQGAPMVVVRGEGIDVPVAQEISRPKRQESPTVPLASRVRPRVRGWLPIAGIMGLSILALTLVPPLRESGSHWFRRGSPVGDASVTPIDGADTSSPTSTHALYIQGLEQLEHYHRSENTDRAIQLFQRVLARDSTSAAAYSGLARAYLYKYHNHRDRSWREKALVTARRAVELDDDLAVAHVSLGLVLADLSELDEAETHLQQALLLDPFSVDAARGLGRIHEERGSFEEAEAVYRQALQMRPEDRFLHDSLGALLYRSGRYLEAEECFLRSLELAPDMPFGHKNLAAVYHMQGKFSQAADRLQRAIELEPTAGLYNNLGTLYFYQGLYQESLSAFEKAFELKGSSNSHRRWANLADAYRWTPDNQEKARYAYLRAIQLLEEELASAPEHAGLRSRLALLLAKRGDCEQSLEQLKELETIEKQEGAIPYRMTGAYEICGSREASLEALQVALRAGYSLEEIRRDPELLDLRDDLRYHQVVMEFDRTSPR